jgi:inosine-uridine nucleoside N-ribohydrolase
MPRKVILDCDPGLDDAVAILLALASPQLDLLAITTVAGNVGLDRTTLNARRVCSAAGRAAPVVAGCDRPLLRELVEAGEIHGASGLGDLEWPEPAVPVQPGHAADLIAGRVMADPGEVTLVATGPLTNLALALRREPGIAKAVREVELMGGSFTRGNQTPAAEFNIYVDPEAASVVFEAGWPLTMVGLDLTHQAAVTPPVIDRIAAVGSPLAGVVVQMLRFLGRTTGAADGPPLHDPCAVARVIDPALVGSRDAFVAVETRGRWTRGMTVVDFAGRLGHPPNAAVATTLDLPAFWDLLVDALARLAAPNR